MQRRLAAILATDVVGYSRLIRVNEEGTIAALQVLRADHIDPKISEHHGRIFKLMGDGMLAEFPSVVDAVRAAVEIQAAVAEHNSELYEDSRMEFRVGINLGDVVIDGDDIQGDGVNVAARLEGLAEPGGICISGSVHEQVRDRINIPFEDMGEVEVKNITRPVRAFRVLANSDLAKAPKQAKQKWRKIVATVMILAVITGGATWLWRQQLDHGPADQSRMTNARPDKPSIAVLPFANLGTDKEQEFFADGISEDLITQLSKLSGLLVISRASTFKYKGSNFGIRRISRELGVRYILDGSVRRGGDQLRVNAQLIDAVSGGHLWAETYNGAVDDVFALQDRINQNIVTALKVRLNGDEPVRITDRGTENLAAYEAFLRGERLRKYSTANVYTRAASEYEEAIAFDPRFAAGHAGLGHVLYAWARFGQDIYKPQKMLARAQELADMSIRVGDAPLGHLLQAKLSLFLKRDHKRAASETQRAIALNPNFAEGYAMLAEVMIYNSEFEEALKLLGQAARLNPGFPDRYRFLKGQAKFHQGKYQAALDDMTSFCKSAASWAYSRPCIFYQVSAYAQAGDIEKAKTFLGIYEQSNMASVSAALDLKFPFRVSRDREKLLNGIARILPQ